MHWAGLSMRDLKSANILVCPLGERLRILISDLDAARLYPDGVPEKRAISDVARLYFDAAWFGAVSRREALFFLNSYLGCPPRDRLKMWVSGISRFVRRKRRTFRPKGEFAKRS
jgi:serine/threonine protein kinase